MATLTLSLLTQPDVREDASCREGRTFIWFPWRPSIVKGSRQLMLPQDCGHPRVEGLEAPRCELPPVRIIVLENADILDVTHACRQK